MSKAVTPVVVVNGSLNGLGVVRSLAYGRMPIHLVTTTRFCPGVWSRHCRVERYSSIQGRDLVDALKDLAIRIGGRPVLILTGDAEVETVSYFRDELSPLLRFSLPSDETVRTLAEKTLFQKFAEEQGYQVPRSVILTEETDLSLLETLSFPVVLKPGNKIANLDGRVERAVQAANVDQARVTAARMLHGASPLIVQEWIHGADTDIYFTLFVCNSAGKPPAIFSGRKLVCNPPAVGHTAVCMAAPEVADELSEMTIEFVERVGYLGVGSLEFKRDSRNGKFYIVEPTVGRTDWQEEIATLCGVNIPLIAYWNELGGTFEATVSDARPVVWRTSIGYRTPRNTLPPNARVVDGHFRLSDPLPGLYYYSIEQFAWRAFRYIGKRILRLAAPMTGNASPSESTNKRNIDLCR
jgi:D-aspartate ligase